MCIVSSSAAVSAIVIIPESARLLQYASWADVALAIALTGNHIARNVWEGYPEQRAASVCFEQARADLGIVTSRGNTGGPHAVQWALPG